jgi:hypothetical protein
MPLDEFRAALQALPAGMSLHVTYDSFSKLFPPGEPDDGARARALQLAMANGCYIENRPQSHEIIFVKCSTPPQPAYG